MKHTIHQDNPRIGEARVHEHPALHGSADSPGLPNLAGAQIPGPGAGRVLAGEDGPLANAAADPWEWQGHVARTGWMHRLFHRAGRQTT